MFKQTDFAKQMVKYVLKEAQLESNDYKAYFGKLMKIASSTSTSDLDILYKMCQQVSMPANATSIKSDPNKRAEGRKGELVSAINDSSFTPKTYFDLGCGDGHVTASVAKHYGIGVQDAYGGDIYDVNNPDIKYIKLDPQTTHIQLDDDSIDLVTAYVALHHIRDVRGMISEIYRIMKPESLFVIREHNCRKYAEDIVSGGNVPAEDTLTATMLDYIHAMVMIMSALGERKKVNVGEFHEKRINFNWADEKAKIEEYLASIRYRNQDDWDTLMQNAGFILVSHQTYPQDIPNPQRLYYAVYKKQ